MPPDACTQQRYSLRRASELSENSASVAERYGGGGHASNLPAQLTPLIERAKEVETALEIARRPEVRLLTLTGPGGVGKTRLGIRVAEDLASDFPDGVCFVSLAPVRDPDLVVAAIAEALGLKESGERSLLRLLKSYLLDRRLLLLPDNF